ncbi:MAG: Omp28-related outer membrane protein [Bacteroidales bacterium]|jgi:hypothetical protein|nr:Omp28-related outer membrane protein [Bacteroidales bacterium]
MKRTFFSLFAVVITSLAFIVSCDNIDEKEILTPIIGETTQSVPITTTDTVQKVLLEDITGWSCTNCPAAAREAANLLLQYPGTLVVMAVHATAFAKPSQTNHNVDFRTEYGEQWVEDFGISGCPSGLVNRVKEGGVFPVQYADWATKVAERMQREHVLDINLGAKYDGDNKIVVSIENKVLKEIDFPMLINVVVLESKIIGVQRDGTEKDTAYEFNHVLRTNGLIDFPLTYDKTDAGTTINKNYFIEVPFKEDEISPLWNLDNCKVVVFVTNAETKEVIQVNEVELQ